MRDAVGFEALYRAHRRHVVAYCLRRAPRADAYEAADETFLIAWRRLDDIPSEQPRAWLYGVAYRVLANRHRGERRRRRLDARLTAGAEAGGVAGPETLVLRSEEQEELWRAYRRLADEDQEVLRLAAWEGLSHEQIGSVLGCEAAAARQRLHRARQRLARQLQRSERRMLALMRRRET